MAFQLRSLGGGLAFPSPPSHWPAWPGHTDHHEPTGHEFAPPGPLDSTSDSSATCSYTSANLSNQAVPHAQASTP